MTATDPRRLIHCKGECPSHGSPPCPHTQTTCQGFPRFEQEATGRNSQFCYNAGRDFDTQLRVYEIIARRRYRELLNNLSLEAPPGWFGKMLNQRILPILSRIGFEESIAKAFFEIASFCWCRMGPANDKIITFHPQMNQEIEEVSRGFELTVGTGNNPFSRLTNVAPLAFSGTINESPAPTNLFALLDDIATPWIVLPRALRFLEKDQGVYLHAYLTTIEREKREPFLLLFGRISAEFVGNFSLKFADRGHRPDQIAKLMLYGYAALFWKTLRCPPENLENSSIFNVFFNWASRLVCKNDYLGIAEHRFIRRMKKMKKRAFPTLPANQIGESGRTNCTRFMVTLRHGCIGLSAVLKYFGIDQFLETRQVVGRLQSNEYYNELHGFLHTIKTNYHLESKRTRAYIQRFMSCLRSAVELMQPDSNQTDRQFLIKRLNNIQILLDK